jgi:hypothetical protein
LAAGLAGGRFSLGTLVLLLSTPSCCRRTRFSRTTSPHSLTTAIIRIPSQLVSRPRVERGGNRPNRQWLLADRVLARGAPTHSVLCSGLFLRTTGLKRQRRDSGCCPRATAQPRAGKLSRDQPEPDSSHDRAGLARAPVRRGGRHRDLCHLRHTSGSAQHQCRAAYVAEIRRTRSGWQPRAILCTARHGDYPDRRLHGASRGRIALSQHLSHRLSAGPTSGRQTRTPEGRGQYIRA